MGTGELEMVVVVNGKGGELLGMVMEKNSGELGVRLRRMNGEGGVFEGEGRG